ncbi:hypothetical protein H4582DRAFT_2061064 [Lactarius indigo]|nr:hypothetical protein H4582DRAFT_2061064 [Lactarius indigo]
MPMEETRQKQERLAKASPNSFNEDLAKGEQFLFQFHLRQTVNRQTDPTSAIGFANFRNAWTIDGDSSLGTPKPKRRSTARWVRSERHVDENALRGLSSCKDAKNDLEKMKLQEETSCKPAESLKDVEVGYDPLQVTKGSTSVELAPDVKEAGWQSHATQHNGTDCTPNASILSQFTQIGVARKTRENDPNRKRNCDSILEPYQTKYDQTSEFEPNNSSTIAKRLTNAQLTHSIDHRTKNANANHSQITDNRQSSGRNPNDAPNQRRTTHYRIPKRVKSCYVIKSMSVKTTTAVTRRIRDMVNAGANYVPNTQARIKKPTTSGQIACVRTTDTAPANHQMHEALHRTTLSGHEVSKQPIWKKGAITEFCERRQAASKQGTHARVNEAPPDAATGTGDPSTNQTVANIRRHEIREIQQTKGVPNMKRITEWQELTTRHHQPVRRQRRARIDAPERRVKNLGSGPDPHAHGHEELWLGHGQRHSDLNCTSQYDLLGGQNTANIHRRKNEKR